ncbi:MAG: sodium:solute symporter family protein [Planctomycetaceae bacterium]|nr:sodium:solute symporter family protein [Planctomycetales bacterium]MCB9939383.1 sodium:solute symporter family protein [Planctomycetaceae bacterium]
MNEFVAEAATKTNFTPIDWCIVVAYLLVSLAIGLVVKRFATSMSAYIAAGRNVGVWLGVASMTGTELGLITVMYSAEKGFKGGFAAFHIAVLAGMVTFVIGVTGFIVAPLRETGVLTIPEYYGRRYGNRTRILGGIILAGGGILNMGLFLKVGSMFIVGVTGLSQQGWAMPVVMTTLLALVLVYTVLGGMISVIVTDYIQFVVLAFGLLLATWLAVAKLGWDNIFTTVESTMGAGGFNPFVSEGHFGVEYVLWMAFLGIVGCALWPTAVARALAMESTEAVKRGFRWSSISFTIRFLIPYFWGICALVFFVHHEPQLAAAFGIGGESSPNGEPPANALYAMPLFIGRLLPAGVIGIVSAAMIAAFMSTHDSYLLCWSSVIVQDVIAPLSQKRLDTKTRVLLTRISIVAIGVYIWAWGLFYKGRDDIWDYMAITGAIYFTGAFALLAGGLYWKRASSTGAFCALIAGCSAVIGLAPIRDPVAGVVLAALGREASPAAVAEFLTSARVGLGTICFTLVVFVVVSLLFPDAAKQEDSEATEGAT